MRPATIHHYIIQTVLLAGLSALIYWPALTGQLVNHDDPLYFSENPVILQGLSWHAIVWSFTSISVGHWHPVTWLSHLAGVELFGTNPFGHHLINLLLHIANTLLLACILRNITGRNLLSWLTTALFALHPLNVETVAWVAERKGVLGAFFWLLAVLAYQRYVRAPGLRRYLPVLFFFALALCSKAMAVTLPFVLLLLDFWPLGRFRQPYAGDTETPRLSTVRLLAEKAPLALLSLMSGTMAIYAMGHGGAIAGYSLMLRIQNVILGYAGYVLKLFYPADLSVFYPFVTTTSGWEVGAKLTVLLAITGFVMLKMNTCPYLFTGWFWYLITMAPLVGFISLGQQTTPDRYAYIPLIGLMVMTVWGTADFLERYLVPIPVRTLAASACIAALAFLSARQAAFWHDSESLFSHAVRVTPYSTMVHNNLGSAYFEKGDITSAFREFREALRLDQGNDTAWNNLGAAYSKVGRNDDAIEAYLLALNANPDNQLARLNLGMAYIGLGDIPSALQQHAILLNRNPAFAAKLDAFLRPLRGKTLH